MNFQNHLRYIVTIFLLIILRIAIAQESSCSNGIDDDNDGFIDCADTECYDEGECSTSFICTNTLYQVISATLKKLDPLTGEYESVGTASASYNGAGFNVQDGYIYGINSNSGKYHLWKINNTGKETDLGVIKNFGGKSFVGDFDEEGNLYTYTSGAFPSLSYIDVDSPELQSKTLELSNLSGGNIPGTADLTYNPVQKKFFGLASGHELVFIDHETITCGIVGDFSEFIDVKGGFGAAWSDQVGNSYFSNNATGKIYRFSFDDNNKIKEVIYVATGQPTNSNDGMGCFFSLPPFETDCSDGIDNDGDGLMDCQDPDCANTGICPAINIEIKSIEKAGPSSIVPFYIELINTSKADAVNFSLNKSLPQGFSFLADSIEYSSNSSFIETVRPVEDQRTELVWDGLNIPIGDTISISFSLLVDKDMKDSVYYFAPQLLDVIQSPFKVGHRLEIDQDIFYEAKTFTCEPAFYQVYKKRGQPNIFGRLNPLTAEYDEIAVIDHQANGLGYDIRSGYSYGSNGKKFMRMDQEGNSTYMGIDFNAKVYVGDVDDQGNWYGKVKGDIVKVNISKNEIEATYEKQGLPGWDMAFNNDGNFYAVHGQELYQFNTTTLIKKSLGKVLGEEVPNSGHGAQWTGIDGYHYISNNLTGKIFRINVSTNEARECMVSESNLQFNDGFACPAELPAVFEYDYGDNLKFPIARQLVYQQDLQSDNIPDYAMVWLGKGITFEILDPSDYYAKGDTYDDGFNMSDDFTPGSENLTKLLLNTNRDNMNASWGVWFDWNNDGEFEEFYNGENKIETATEVELAVRIPEDFDSEAIAVRVRISTNSITKDHFKGDINEPGEVEDYIISTSNVEVCGNGDDDDRDGLVDCDDPDCAKECDYTKTGSSGNGGLESNDNLINKITEAFYQRKLEGDENRLDRNNLMNIRDSNTTDKSQKTKTNNKVSLRDLIPIDVIPSSETYISSPQYLIDLTNATDLFSVDIYQGDSRVAAILSLESTGGVYEHTKYICDRLTGSQILDILEYKIDGTNKFIITKLQLPNGNIEYALSFSVRGNTSGNMTLESYWNLDDYSKADSYLNFQIWANNTKNLVALTTEILRLININTEINEYKLGASPKVYIQSGVMNAGELILQVVNKSGIKELRANGTLSKTETTDQESISHNIELTGETYEEVQLSIGDVYYLGLAFFNNENVVEDAIFLANGAWGYSLNPKKEEVIEYKTISTSHDNKMRYNVQRSIQANGNVQDYISFYRSLAPRFTSKNLDTYNSISFRAKGSAKLEIAIIKEGVSDWQEQGKTIIELTAEEQEYVLGKDFFENATGQFNDWKDVTMIAVNVIGDKKKARPFNFEITDVAFGHQSEEHHVLVYAENIIGPKDTDHNTMTFDGTSTEAITIMAGEIQSVLETTIENISKEKITIDDITIESPDNNFSIIDFEPSDLTGNSKGYFNIGYNPISTPDTATAQVFVSWYDDDVYETIEFEISALAACVLQDDISTADIKRDSRKKDFKAINSISSDATIFNGKTITYSAKEEIIFNDNFEVKAGAELMLFAKDKCTTNQ